MALTLVDYKGKERIETDVDDTIFDFINPFFANYNVLHKTNFRKKDANGAPLEKILGISFNELQHEFNLFYDTSEFSRLPLIPRAAEILKGLGKEYYVPIVTTRPAHIKDKTRHQLSLYLDGTILGITFALKKEKAQKYLELEPKAIIDDDLQNIQSIPEDGPEVFLVDQPWNQAKTLPHNFHRVGDWKRGISPWPEIMERLK